MLPNVALDSHVDRELVFRAEAPVHACRIMDEWTRLASRNILELLRWWLGTQEEVDGFQQVTCKIQIGQDGGEVPQTVSLRVES